MLLSRKMVARMVARRRWFRLIVLVANEDVFGRVVSDDGLWAGNIGFVGGAENGTRINRLGGGEVLMEYSSDGIFVHSVSPTN